MEYIHDMTHLNSIESHPSAHLRKIFKRQRNLSPLGFVDEFKVEMGGKKIAPNPCVNCLSIYVEELGEGWNPAKGFGDV